MFFCRKTSTRQKVLLCSSFVPEKLSLPPLVLTTFSKCHFLWFQENLIKKSKSCWPPHFTHFLTIAKSQNFTSFKITSSSKQAFSLERCRKNQFWHSHAAWESLFFLIRTQRGNAKNNVCDTSPARMRFFSFFRHLPSGKLKNHENALLEPPCRRHVAKDAIRKLLQKSQIPLAIWLFLDLWHS